MTASFFQPGNRYTLQEQLGSGAMGVVYRAVDRLNGRVVALKRVAISGKGDSCATEEDVRLALAQEFRLLATLRHPHIISVLDYGFDNQGRPYFTMDLLENARTLLEAGQGAPEETAVNLLVQLLQALAYLHRRGILHRDLKPANVLVTNGRLRTLDFGLSTTVRQTQGSGGTLAYMPPEVLRQTPAGPPADLYAVGVMACQLFTGKYPFPAPAHPLRLMNSILYSEPDLSAIPNPHLAAVVGRLLQKEPEERYPDAGAVIEDLCRAVKRPLPPENPAIRESFLQAAQFVGRDAELEQLINALDEAAAGRGSAWLVGGESGIGKSRLLEEARIRALVKGAIVLRGQAGESGGLAYQLWRPILRHIALIIPLTDLEASVLKQIVPDLPALLKREISDPPDLEGESNQRRLRSTIVEVCQRAAQTSAPLVLLLEDLHWANESLAPLKTLSQSAARLPLLIIGSYRREERPELPLAYPGMQTIFLNRLPPDSIRELAVSMLGDAGKRPQTLALLQKETEGNVFFLVETVRALAEAAGRLGAIGQTALPEEIVAGGVQQIIRRRIDRIPPADRPLLDLAAVIGRALDLDLLQTAAPDANMENLLTAAANIAVLEVQENNWQFSHSKLRDALLAELDQEQRRALHRQAAVAYERVYAGNPAYAAPLATHWNAAGEQEKTARYAHIAGRHAAAQFIYEEAIHFFNLALSFTPEQDVETRAALLLAREEVYDIQGKRKEQEEDLNRLEKLFAQVKQKTQAAIALRRAHYLAYTGNYSEAIKRARQTIHWAEEANETPLAMEGRCFLGELLLYLKEPEARASLEQTYLLAQAGEDPKMVASALRALGVEEQERGDYAGAQEKLERAFAIYREIGDWLEQADTLNSLANLAANKGDLVQSRLYHEEGLAIARKVGHWRVEAGILLNLSETDMEQGDYHQAQRRCEQTLAIARETGHRTIEESAIISLGTIALHLGKYAQARKLLERGLAMSRETGDEWNEARTLYHLGNTAEAQGENTLAESYYWRAWELSRNIVDREGEGYILTHLAYLKAQQGMYDEAQAIIQQAIGIRRELGNSAHIKESLSVLAQISFEQGNIRQAEQCVTEILAHDERRHSFEGAVYPLRIYWICFQVLAAVQSPQAGQLLQDAYDLLQERAARIPDEATRCAFLTNVPWRREIVAAWEKRD